MNKTNLESILKEEPLLMGDISRNFMDWPSLLQASHPSLFFGVGLCTSKEPAVAIPFDILSFFFLAEKLRRQLELDTIFVLIADEHARTNPFMTEQIIFNLVNRMKSTFTMLTRNLHLKNFQIILSSDLHNNPEFKTMLDMAPSVQNEYLKREIADLLWFTTKQNVRLKLGWSINNDPNAQGHDERFFDTQIQKMGKLPLSFLHSSAGRTFDSNRPKASPYIAVANESRILLLKDENVKEKLDLFRSKGTPEVSRGAISHLNLIVRLFESLFIRIPKHSLEEKIQFIIDLSTQG